MELRERVNADSKSIQPESEGVRGSRVREGFVVSFFVLVYFLRL